MIVREYNMLRYNKSQCAYAMKRMLNLKTGFVFFYSYTHRYINSVEKSSTIRTFNNTPSDVWSR